MERVKELLSQNRARSVALTGLVIIALAIPITLRLVGEQQDIRQRAAGSFSCEFQAGVINEDDVWLRVLNISGDATGYDRISWKLGNNEGEKNEHTVATDPTTFYEQDFRNTSPGSYRALAEFYSSTGARAAVSCGEKWITVSDTSDNQDNSNDSPSNDNSTGGGSLDSCLAGCESYPNSIAINYCKNHCHQQYPDHTNNGGDQDNTTTVDPPSVSSITLPQQPRLTGKGVSVSASGGSSGTEYRYYIHGSTSPKTSDKVNDSYNPDFVETNAFYLVGQSSSSVELELPTDPGDYYITVNAEKENVGCAWDGRVYQRQSSNNIEFTGESCNNDGPQQITVSHPNVSNLTLSNTNPQPGETINVTVTGEATKYWFYLHGSSTPDAGDQTTGTYNHTSTIESNRFYNFDMTDGSATSLQVPTTPGKYFLITNAHSHTKENAPWHEYDRACAWNGEVYRHTSGGVNSVASCNNPGYKEITVEEDNSGNDNNNGDDDNNGGAGDDNNNGDDDNNGGTGDDNNSGNDGSNGDNTSDEILVTANLQMPGIGQNTGDNPNPQNPERDLDLIVFNQNNEEVLQTSGTVQFDGQSTYTGTINLGDMIDETTYYFITRFKNTLKSSIVGTYQVAKGQEVELSTTTLIPGDLDQNNTLDAKDYNIFITCYGQGQCSEKDLADFNDDGSINGVDYNIFLRSFTIIQGD